MSFKYDIKETYTAEEVKNIINDHSKFVKKDTVSKIEYEKLQEMYQPLKAEKEAQVFKNTLKEKLSTEKVNDIDKILKYGGFSADDTDETYANKLKTLKSDLPHLFGEQKGISKEDVKGTVEGENKPDYSSLGIQNGVKM